MTHVIRLTNTSLDYTIIRILGSFSIGSFTNMSLVFFSTGSLMNKLQDLFVSIRSLVNRSLGLAIIG